MLAGSEVMLAGSEVMLPSSEMMLLQRYVLPLIPRCLKGSIGKAVPFPHDDLDAMGSRASKPSGRERWDMRGVGE
jgi:hypothetical protein